MFFFPLTLLGIQWDKMQWETFDLLLFGMNVNSLNIYTNLIKF